VYWLHKLHHKYKETTPWSAFSFHPLDGFAQSVPYHLFALFFPMHSRLYTATLMLVGLWTVNIHDRMTLRLWGVNGAAHHTVHHVAFNYNYGQYFTWSDHVFGTFKDPHVSWPYELDETQLALAKQKDRDASSNGKAANSKQVQPVDNSPTQSQKKKGASSKKKQ
jgi:lathosterol oxidase